MAGQVRFYRSAAQIGITQTAVRTSETTRRHNALTRRLSDRYFTRDWRIPRDTTARNATSA